MRDTAIAIGVLVGLASTAFHFAHPDSPASVEWWLLGMLIGFEIAVVTAGSTLVVSCIAHRALDRRRGSLHVRPALCAHETGEGERPWAADA